MEDTKEKILIIMRHRKALDDKAFGGKYPFRIATWNLRFAMEDRYPSEIWTCADLRKVLNELVRDGKVIKSKESRIGQAVWELVEVK